METKTIYVLVEPNYLTPVWHAKIISGLQETAAKGRLRLQRIEGLDGLEPLSGKANSIILISTQDGWTKSAILRMRRLRMRPILLGAVPSMFGEDVSGIVLNHKALIETMVHYFYSCGRRKIALLGINPYASNDVLKCTTFLSAARFLKMNATNQDIYDYHETNAMAHCKSFLKKGNQYDGVICSNDYIAASLLKAAKECGIKIPEKLYVAGIGNMLLCSCISPSLTSAARYYYETGQQALNIWSMLEKDPSVTSIISTVQCKIICRESTAFSPLPPPIDFEDPLESETILPPKNESSMELQRLENCLLQCDALDFKIIQGIARKATLEELAASLFISQRALRYRLNKIYASAEALSRSDLETMMEACGLEPQKLSFLLQELDS